MTSNIAIGKGALGFIPPISLAFWRWFVVFLFMLPVFVVKTTRLETAWYIEGRDGN